MSATNKAKKIETANAEQVIREFESDVLFQKIFDKWYAFSVVDGECMMTLVPEDQISKYSSKAKAIK